MYICDEKHLTLSQIEAILAQLAGELKARNQRIGLVAIDRLSSIRQRRGLPGVMKGLKRLADRFGVPMLVTEGLTVAEKDFAHEPMRPALQFRDRAVIKHADLVGLLYREAYYRPLAKRTERLAELVLAKNVHGPKGSIKLSFARPYTVFA